MDYPNLVQSVMLGLVCSMAWSDIGGNMTNRELLQLASTVKHNLEKIDSNHLSINDMRYFANARVNLASLIRDLQFKVNAGSIGS